MCGLPVLLIALSCGSIREAANTSHEVLGASGLKSDASARASPPQLSAKESVRAELIRLQKQIGLTLVSFYRDIQFVVFANRSLSEGRELLPEAAAEGAVSRDGTEIAVDLWQPNTGIYLGIVGSDGTNVRRYPDIAGPYDICWSYDKSKLAFSVQNLNRGTTPPNDSLEILNLTSRMSQEVDVRAYTTSQCWSPDNKEIAYDADDSVRVYDVERKRWTVLAKGRQATWSPDGKWIAFLDNDTYYAIRPSGEERKLLFKREGALTGLWWSPDSRIVAYVSRVAPSEGSWMAVDVGFVRLRVRRLQDGSEDWVAGFSDVHVPSYQWVTSIKLNIH